ncbi:Acyl-homoserine-lactone synthase [Methylocella tundrae]|jgi:N-acyl-L-homoserine lactone synthetase|uniref:Acyl-homoserine-lactone synthase n=1 Tax=Methylocella tundrae TaxID=227605 RepID=A0A4U8YUR7_METTU|nr:acyl-homoserine-lactone synthase [Methylocella tundrae]WPP04806.1 acyl-homoserine-lactone synthase [Methylocella tundrae]VFU07041.1 Acyl-homoserine-lactone synthase [Methylocella tundrae]VTZ27330.1 Acyl-homoserine-lactone synthase [Methylocella tundrae]VTZ50110.1 Acyl-homoserine-lactone synthase [Methylocella tundrae]
MIKYIFGYERQEHPELFDEMFRQRKKIFIDEKKWDIKAVDGEFEIDEYDRDDTVYVVSLRPDGSLAGSVRLLSTVTDHMASGAFQHMFPGLMIRSPTIWEATRFAVAKDQRMQRNGISRAACEVMLGTFLFGLEHGVSQLTGIYEAPNARIYRKCGVKHFILGRHRSAEHGAVHFALADVSRDMEIAIREATGLKPVEVLAEAAE